VAGAAQVIGGLRTEADAVFVICLGLTVISCGVAAGWPFIDAQVQKKDLEAINSHSHPTRWH
jgi:hypothetical protein